MQRALAHETLHYELPAHPLNRAGKIKGTLVGGNLSVLYGLQGTNFAPSLCREGRGGSVLFIEDVGERHYHIDRMMNNLRLSGVLANLSGLIVGQFSDCEDDPSMGCTVYETIRHAVEPYHYPVVFNFPAGHVEENMPLYLNAPVEMDVQEDYSSSIHSFFKSS